MPAVLNLSNEVVKLRAEVKRVKVLLIRKLIRQISALEKKKGSPADLERHRRRAVRLREEIHELKVIVPDKVTKAALQKDISFEKVCRNKEASLSERAIARIATHPQFSKKIQSIKEAIKAFKEERINSREAEKQAKSNAEDITLPNQPQEASDDKGLEILHDDVEEKLNEEEGDKIIDKPQEENCGSSQVSQMSSLETSNEQTNLCSKAQMSTIQEQVPEEVVRMRKEVKRTRVLVISKLTQQVAALKKKKDQESEVKDLIAKLMKDIQALRSLKPDQLTVTALQENNELEKVLLDHQTSPLDRAIARIVTHSRFINKLQKVKEAIEKERAKAAEAKQRKLDRQNMLQSKNKSEEVEGNGDEEDDDAEEKKDEYDNEEDEEEHDNEKDEEDDDNEEDDTEEDDDDDDDDVEVEDKLDSSSINIHKFVESESTASDAVKLPPVKEITTPEKSGAAKVKSQNEDTTALKGSSEKSLAVCSTESRLPKSMAKPDRKPENTIKPQNKQDLPENKPLQSKKDDEESDLSDDDDDDDDEEEKEYFDDSTEERFHKQSSQSEESDDDDFFVGKVSKFKKRKSGQAKVEGNKSKTQKPDKSQDVEKAHEPNLGKLQSVFCSTLSKSSINSLNTKPGSRRDRLRNPQFQNQKKGLEGRMKTSPFKDPGTDRKAEPFKPNKQTFKFARGPPGAERGKSQFEQHRNPRGPSVKISNPPQQSLHPSWEASRKRKEQQAQITVFQGKKIKFDDD